MRRRLSHFPDQVLLHRRRQRKALLRPVLKADAGDVPLAADDAAGAEDLVVHPVPRR